MFHFPKNLFIGIFCISGFLAYASVADEQQKNTESRFQLPQKIHTATTHEGYLSSAHKKGLWAAGITSGLALSAGIAWFALSTLKKTPSAHQSNGAAVVIDFDQCMMKKHWFGDNKYRDLSDINPQAEDFGIDNPQRAFQQIINTPGTTLAVASFGRKDIIRKALQAILPPKDMRKVIIKTPSDFNLPDGTAMEKGKNDHLHAINRETGIPLNNMIFFDDSQTNIDLATSIGVYSLYAKPFTDKQLNNALTFLKNRLISRGSTGYHLIL